MPQELQIQEVKEVLTAKDLISGSTKCWEGKKTPLAFAVDNQRGND